MGYSDTLYKWLLGCLLITLKLINSFSAPISTIETPCGAPVTITDVNRKPSEQTISQLNILLNEAKFLAQTSKFEIAKSIDSTEMRSILDNRTFLQTINADEIKKDINIKTDLGKLFQRNFGNFSELAIYTDFAAKNADSKHVCKVKAVLNKLWAILCELQIGILSQGESITQYLNTSIIISQISSPASSEETLFRNYEIIQDVEKNLEQFTRLYKNISVAIKPGISEN